MQYFVIHSETFPRFKLKDFFLSLILCSPWILYIYTKSKSLKKTSKSESNSGKLITVPYGLAATESEKLKSTFHRYGRWTATSYIKKYERGRTLKEHKLPSAAVVTKICWVLCWISTFQNNCRWKRLDDCWYEEYVQQHIRWRLVFQCVLPYFATLILCLCRSRETQ